MKKHKLYDICSQVPINYYQRGIKKNIFQKIWHNRKISLAKQLIGNLSFTNCLDVGCASGFMISQIAEVFPQAKYFGVDIYQKAIEHAQKIYPKISFKSVSSDRLPFQNNSFDLILCFETIEHVEKPVLILKEIKRVLRKNGTLILAMDSGSLLFRLVWLVWENTTGKVWKGSHLHPFHHSELDKIISRSGFKALKKSFSHWGMEVVYILKKYD